MTVDRTRLAELEAVRACTLAGMVERVEMLEAEVASLRRTVAAPVRAKVNQPISAVCAPDGNLGEQGAKRADIASRKRGLLPATSALYIPATPVLPPPLSRRESRPQDAYVRASGGSLRMRADAARWLARHGVNVLTPKSWLGWREVELELCAMLGLAMRLHNPVDWRVTRRLQRCGDPACVCAEMLAALAARVRPSPRTTCVGTPRALPVTLLLSSKRAHAVYRGRGEYNHE